MTLTKEDSVAVHEAGHAVMSVKLKKNLEYVTIVPKGNMSGCCYYGEDAPSEDKGKMVLREVLILLAGVAAECLILGINPKDSRGKDDFDEANKIFEAPHDGLAVLRSNDATKKTWDMFRNPKAQQQIIAVAEALKEHKTLSGERVVEIMNQQTA